MDTDGHGFFFREETHQIIGCAMEVLNTLGHGLWEKPYENALVVELGLQGVPFEQQPRYDVVYKAVKVGEYIPDLIVHEKIVVDTKTIEQITDHEKGQILNYLKITGLRAGLILNFKYESTLKTPSPKTDILETAISRHPTGYSRAECANWTTIKW